LGRKKLKPSRFLGGSFSERIVVSARTVPAGPDSADVPRLEKAIDEMVCPTHKGLRNRLKDESLEEPEKVSVPTVVP
jgi:hypothetical protein